jgi:NAD(P)-dependent dehydrogenase (short-subunit alcohol dehydrogenase family)
MQVKDKVVVVTGGASGIGRALAQRFANDGAKHVVVADLDGEGAATVANAIGGSSFRADVSKEADIQTIIAETEKSFGSIDLFCSNAGVLPVNPDFDNAASSTDAEWQRSWAVHVMAHVYAARALLPGMIKRGSGYFLNTVSAAGLLSQIGSAAYSTTKHAAIGFAESLAITHKDHGIRVSVLCPQAVQTAMIEGQPTLGADVDGILTAERVAEITIEGLERETFLILPHPSVAGYYAKKTENYDRWLGGMAKLRRAVMPNVAHLKKS